jgi:lactate dehydrogenase-like 2-hydroxyacid dehydrogenase
MQTPEGTGTLKVGHTNQASLSCQPDSIYSWATHHKLSAISKMRPGAILTNTSRGAIVDE